MNHRLSAVLSLALLAVGLAVPGTAAGAGPSVSVRYALTCNGLREGLPVDFDNSFDARDPFIQFYVRLQVVPGTVRVTEQWYDPGGVLIASREYPDFAGGPIYNYIDTKKLAPGQTAVPNTAGWYRIDLTVGDSDTPLVSIPFMYDPLR
ncbi:MAG: hypothetical protein NUW23_00030 [Firmicutes bacterium]|jgi:hypothetical protein|nr:hypothetical protein [Bacillota bacterium]